MRAAPLLAALVIALSTSACAQSPLAYQPTPFQVGKDVVWVPTPQSLVDKLLYYQLIGVCADGSEGPN